MATPDKHEKTSKWRHVLRRRQTSTESAPRRSPPAASPDVQQTTPAPLMTRQPRPSQPMVGQQYYGIFGQGARRRPRPTSGEPVSPGTMPETFLLPHPPTPRKDGTLQQLIKQLSLKDDPRQFGPGTLAARRMQREELDSMMARDLFRREVAVNLQNRPHPQAARQASGSSPPKSPDSGPESPPGLDEKTMRYLRSAFTDEEWASFSKDPLHYLHKHGLPKQKEEPSPTEEVIEEADEDENLTEASGAATSSVPETKPSKGLSPEEIACVVTQFPFYDTKEEKKPGRSRVKGTRMPKGAPTKGILSNDESNECSICLGEFEFGEKIALLPCCHRFHAECVTDWLQRDASCPECREDFKENLR